MMRMLGAVLTAVGAAWIGFGMASDLRGRRHSLEEMADGLEQLSLSLEWDAPPLPRMMERAVSVSRGTAREVFQGCAGALEEMDGESFGAAWCCLIEERSALGEEGQQVLLPLGNVLGRCDSREQQRIISGAAARLRELAQRSEEDYQRQGKVYRTLGLSGGAFLVILLL